MGRPKLIVLVVLATIGSWLFFRDAVPTVKTEGVASRRGWSFLPTKILSGDLSYQPPIPSLTPVVIPVMLPKDPRYVRIASFNVDWMQRDKKADSTRLHAFATIMAQFDIVAIQDVMEDNSFAIGMIVDQLNASGRSYGFVLGPRVGRGPVRQQLGFVFDLTRVEIDGREIYTVEDPDDLLNVDPLVAWFRTKGPPSQEAFTFSLVNVNVDPHERNRENMILGSVVRAVRNDRRGEDDVIMLGDFDEAAVRLAELMRLPDPIWAITDSATDTTGSEQLDNLVCSRQFTDESTGRSGVYDFLRDMNLSMEQALEISNHLPVWAEFTMQEGGLGIMEPVTPTRPKK